MAKVFEHGDQENIIREELDRLCAAGKLSEEDRRAVREQDLVRFCKTDLLKQLAAAESQGKLWREQPFVIGLPGDEADGSDPEETVLIQGIIDAFFEEEDDKTDRVHAAKELKERYQAQLDYYARAVAQTTGKTVKEKLIYSFSLGKTIFL